MAEEIAGTKPNIGLVDPATGFLNKAVDAAIERFSMNTQNKRVIASTSGDGTPPEKIIADANIRKERNNTSNIDNSNMNVGGTKVVPIAVGGGLVLASLIAIALITRKGK